MILQDLHVHTNYCDGKDSPRDIVLAAVAMGITTLGFSGHSYTDFDESFCMSKQGVIDYKREIASLKREFADKLEILCGVEQDLFSKEDVSGFDYVIGSMHYICVDKEYISIDFTPDILKSAASKYFGGDMLSLAEYYYDSLAAVAEKTKCNIVGHFDLITKFNESEHFIDESNTRYIAAYKRAIDRIIKTCKLFEINTGAMSRGYRTAPYPSREIMDYIREKGGTFILSSDSHSKESLCYLFDRYKDFV